MKVLRTALFSAFLMICFMQTGYAQAEVQMNMISMAPSENVGCVNIVYNTSVLHSNQGLAAPGTTRILFGNYVLYSESVNGTLDVNVEVCITESQVLFHPEEGFLFNCETCSNDPGEPNCEKDGCTVTVIPGKGGRG